MAYVARVHLTWGEGTIAPGEPVPEEEGRDYASLVRAGRIAEVHAPEEMSDEQLAAEVKRLTERVEELTAPPEVPEDVTSGETPGWPVDESGEPYKLPDEVRQLIAHLEGEVDRLEDVVASTESEEGSPGEAEGDSTTKAEAEKAASGGEEGSKEASDGDPGLPEGVKALGGGFYVLPDGSKVRGRKAVEKALASTTEED